MVRKGLLSHTEDTLRSTEENARSGSSVSTHLGADTLPPILGLGSSCPSSNTWRDATWEFSFPKASDLSLREEWAKATLCYVCVPVA